jgi:hypothetical protein
MPKGGPCADALCIVPVGIIASPPIMTTAVAITTIAIAVFMPIFSTKVDNIASFYAFV